MMKCHSVSSQPWLLSDPLSMLMFWSANAEVGKIAHAIMSRVAAVTAIRPAVVRRLLSFVLVLREPIICSDLPFALPVGTTGDTSCPITSGVYDPETGYFIGRRSKTAVSPLP
jgi:hypothetical protein